LAVYTGEWKGGFRDGFGVQVWPDSARYEGEWQENRAHGKGKFVHVDETFMKECGPTIKPTDKESINMSMELCIKVNGRKISSMEKEQKPGLMIHAIKVITLSAASTVLELINGTINLNIPETGAKIKSVELVSIHG
jgi:hypothetical protein